MALKMEADVIEILIEKDRVYKEISNILESDSIELNDYSDEIVMIVDEVGKYKDYNPVFQLKTIDGITLEIAG